MTTKFETSRLESLLESAKLLNGTLDLDGLLRHLLRTVMGRLLVSKAAIALESNGRMEVSLCRGLPLLTAGSAMDADTAAGHGLAHYFPIGDPEQPVGALAVPALAAGKLDDGEREFIEALLGLAATGIANARAHRDVVKSNASLDQKIQELRALLDLVRGLAATTEPEEVAQMLTLTLSGRYALRKHAIHTWKAGQPAIERAKGFDGLDGTVLRKAVEDCRGNSCPGDELGLPAGSVVFPLRSGDTATGVVICGPKIGARPYTEADLEFGSGLVAQASVALDNAWHFRDTLIKQQMEKELTLAASIQADLFPKTLPVLEHSELAARNRQARQVGGDYYDALPYGLSGANEPHLLCVADISGKGIAAALLMSIIQATLRALLSTTPSLKDIAAQTNDLLWASTPSNKYATAFFLRYQPETGEGEFVNGGHQDGVLLRASGEVELLKTTGMPVGLFPKRLFDSEPVQLNAGDLLYICSDGVTDACTRDDREFGVDRLVEVLKGCASRPAADIIEDVFQAIDTFVGDAPQFDDITMMVLKRTQ
jgi:phosphoserine phosphatase RsbU/P